jgi:hypothetical protein
MQIVFCPGLKSMDPVLYVDILSMEIIKTRLISPRPRHHLHPTTTTIPGHQLVPVPTNRPKHGHFRISSVLAGEGIHVGIQEQVVVVVLGDYQDEMRCLRKKILIRDEGRLVCWEGGWYGEFVADTLG